MFEFRRGRAHAAVAAIAFTLLTACGGGATENAPVQADAAALRLAGPELVHNGGFRDGLTGWTPWLMDGGDAEFSAHGGHARVAIKTTATDQWGIQLHTGGLALEAGKTYRFAFRARAEAPTQVDALVWENGHDVDGNGFEWTPYRYDSYTFGTEWTRYAVDFTMPVTNADAGICFFLGLASGKVLLDDVSLVELVPPPPGTELVRNGRFDHGLEGWTTYLMNGGDAEYAVRKREAVVTVKTTASDYSGIQLSSNGLPLFAGHSYRLTFRARADHEGAVIEASVWENGHDLDGNGFAWSPYVFGSYPLTTEPSTFTADFTMPLTNADAGLCFFLGDQRGQIVIDDVSVVAVN